MRSSVPSWLQRARATSRPGLAAPILGAFALVLLAVSGMFALQLGSVRSLGRSADSARHSEEVAGDILRRCDARGFLQHSVCRRCSYRFVFLEWIEVTLSCFSPSPSRCTENVR